VHGEAAGGGLAFRRKHGGIIVGYNVG
jgi:hypothetical protein